MGLVRIIGGLRTADGQWQVQVVQDGRRTFYRLIHGKDVTDRLAIATLERLLRGAGVDMAEMVEVPVTGGVGQAG